MIFLQLFWTFLKIGLFTFGGGAAMVSLIQSEVTVHHQWITTQEYTDILAISQMTPGPIGINTATYTGYTAVLNAGYSHALAVVGSLLASFAVILLPALLMVLAVQFLQRYRNNVYINSVFRLLRIVVVGVIAAAALQLATPQSFGQPAVSLHFITSVVIFVAVFTLSLLKKNPIWLMLASGVAGLLLYGLV